MATSSTQLHHQAPATADGKKTSKRSSSGLLLTRQQEKEVIQLYVEKLAPATEIATAYGVSVKTIYRTLKVNNIDFRQHPNQQWNKIKEQKETNLAPKTVQKPRLRRKRLPKTQEHQVCAAYKRRVPNELILTMFGIKEGHLYSILNRYDIPRQYRKDVKVKPKTEVKKEIDFVIKPPLAKPVLVSTVSKPKSKSILSRIFGRVFGF